MKKLILLILASLLFAVPAMAGTREQRAAITEAKNLAKAQAKFTKTLAKLQAKADKRDLKAVKRALRAVGKDSDNDGVSDIYEDGAGGNSCNPDSDGDGRRDDSDDDNGEEIESKGEIAALDNEARTITVASKTFTINDFTFFKYPLTEETLEVGLCVEVEGHATSDTEVIASKIKRDNDCAGGDDD